MMAIVVAILFLLLSPSGFAAEMENVSYQCSCGKVFSSETKWLKHKEKCDAIVVEETVPTTTEATTVAKSTTTAPATVAPTTAAPTTTVAETVETTEELTTETTFIVPVIDYSDFVEAVVAENATTTAPTTVATTSALVPTTTAPATTTPSTTAAETTTAPTTTVTESKAVTSDAFYADAEPTAALPDEEVVFPDTGSMSRGVIAAIAVAASSVLIIGTVKKKDT